MFLLPGITVSPLASFPANPVQVLEPHKCSRWEWKTWGDVRAVMAEEGGQSGKVFLPIVNLLEEQPDIEVLTRPT